MQSSSNANDRTDEALRFVFSFFDAGFDGRKHLPDSQVRKPEVLAKLVHDLGIAPDPRSTVLVSGSKGKGTTARLIAWSLQVANQRVGLVVSPEEIQHLDRIRINNTPITGKQFADIVEELKQPLLLLAEENPAPYYHSPSDLFLLIALVWFSRQKVDCCVLEGGRGVRFDLIGSIDAAVACVSSVLPEHLHWIGPTIDDVACDKLSLLLRSECIVLPASLMAFASHLDSRKSQVEGRVIWLDCVPADSVSADSVSADSVAGANDFPDWFLQNARLAQAAIQQLQIKSAGTVYQSIEAMCQWGSPSYQALLWPGTATRVFLDGAIDANCFDRRQLARLAGPRCAVVVGLSSDKASEPLLKLLNEFPFGLIAKIEIISVTANPVQIRQSPNRHPWLGVIDLSDAQRPVTNTAQNSQVNRPLDPAHPSAVSPELQAELFALCGRYETIYFVGIQLFLRSLRAMLGMQLMGPQSASIIE